jgi:hypothetical protein
VHRFPPEIGVEPSDLPPGIVELLELLAARTDLGSGEARLEAIFKDGALRFCYLHTGSLERNELRQRFDAG